MHPMKASNQQIADPPSATDPVCGMKVSDSMAVHLEHDGTAYTFCSASCRDAFASEPQRYTSTSTQSGNSDKSTKKGNSCCG